VTPDQTSRCVVKEQENGNGTEGGRQRTQEGLSDAALQYIFIDHLTFARATSI
jgi:hypothetical protein